MNSSSFLQGNQPTPPFAPNSRPQAEEVDRGSEIPSPTKIRAALLDCDPLELYLLKRIGESSSALKVRDVLPDLRYNNSTVSERMRSLCEPEHLGVVLSRRIKGGAGDHGAYRHVLADGVTLGMVLEVIEIKRINWKEIPALSSRADELNQKQRDSVSHDDEEEPEESPIKLGDSPEVAQAETAPEHQDISKVVVARLIQEIVALKEDNAKLKQKMTGLEDRLVALEKKLLQEAGNDVILTKLDQLLGIHQNGKIN